MLLNDEDIDVILLARNHLFLRRINKIDFNSHRSMSTGLESNGVSFSGLMRHGLLVVDIGSNMSLAVPERSLIRPMFLIEFNVEKAGCSGLVLMERRKALAYFRRRNGERLI